MLETLAHRELVDGSPERAIVTANVMLRHAPRLPLAWIYRGSAYSKLLRRDIVPYYQRLSDMPPEIRVYADGLHQQNLADFAQAEALGWTEREGEKQ